MFYSVLIYSYVLFDVVKVIAVTSCHFVIVRGKLFICLFSSAVGKNYMLLIEMMRNSSLIFSHNY